MTELKLKSSATSRLYDTKPTSVSLKEKNQNPFSIVLNERTSVSKTLYVWPLILALSNFLLTSRLITTLSPQMGDTVFKAHSST